ncbi:MAG: YbaK/EbsC family protein [bacterium]|jgi:Ala-tRNA(Pro) deacylase|nr:YbaK/EbsC family protein [bacterium]
MPAVRTKEFLQRHHIAYTTIPHPPAYTAQEIAAEAHIPGKEMAKTVMVKLDGKLAMLVLPATTKIDFNRLKQCTGAQEVELARESEFLPLFPDCETGAMPPFGDLYGVDVMVADRLAEDEEIAFNAGTHRELIRMSYQDFCNLVHPTILHFSKG